MNSFMYFDEECAKLHDVPFLAQGTLYTDVIESGTKNAQTIKSHHNVGGLPEDMRFLTKSSHLNTLFKDEVRALGEALGLPHEIVWRQPFPRTRSWYPCSWRSNRRKNFKSFVTVTLSYVMLSLNVD